MSRPEAPLRIAIAGAGMGGLALAAALCRQGTHVQVHEQARQFQTVGAGIQLTANAVRALRPFGLEAPLRARSFVAEAAYNRDGQTGEITNVLPMGERLERRYGAPDLMLHRAVLHEALRSAVPEGVIQLGRRLASFQAGSDAVALLFSDGTQCTCDTLIGADGIHSVVRQHLFGPEQPRFTGRVAYRTTYPTRLLGQAPLDARGKWWGTDRHIVHYYTTAARDEIYFIAVTPEPEFSVESWSAIGDRRVLECAFSAFHPEARRILAAAPEVRKWALVEREPMSAWGRGPVSLLGDACHPMPPFMAQGAASAIEDAIVLARCLEGIGRNQIPAALRRYEATRMPRTARIQRTNRANTWLRGPTDTDWVYDYDAWNAPLA
jgi:salicylate hydroxylase/6-hydroxynicotinate 3-monooxygenase